ncbi:hypothetical protein L7F22_025448 [Adiantum nelumboides]|nr:hypothetical protein [Adiantum nelumboides]
MVGAIDDLFTSVDVKPHDIGILITNCSVFSPTPSLATIIVNRYQIPVDVKSFCLSGMGCAAGVLALDLAHRLLLTRPRTYALVVSTENVTQNLYRGNHRSMLVTNCLFRAGASAMLHEGGEGDAPGDGGEEATIIEYEGVVASLAQDGGQEEEAREAIKGDDGDLGGGGKAGEGEESVEE